MRIHILSLVALGMGSISCVSAQGYVIQAMELGIWTEVGEKGHSTISPHYEGDNKPIEQDAADFDFWERVLQKDGKDVTFEKIGNFVFWQHDKPEDRWFDVYRELGDDGPKKTECKATLAEDVKANADWYVGLNDNRVENRPEGLTVWCTKAGGFFDEK